MMRMGKEMMIFLVVMINIIYGVVSKGEVYKVDWTNNPPVSYKSWVASHHFHVGDTILLEYNKEFHDVVRVSHKNFNLCNSTKPIARWTTGNDSFTIKKPGHFYFISSFTDNCQSGQKLDIRVITKRHPLAPVPSPFPPSNRYPQSPQSSAAAPPAVSDSAPPLKSHHKSGCSSLIIPTMKHWVLSIATFGISHIVL